MVNKAKKIYKRDFYEIVPKTNKENTNNNLIFLIYKEIFGGEIKMDKRYYDLIKNKKFFYNNYEINSKYFTNKARKKLFRENSSDFSSRITKRKRH